MDDVLIGSPVIRPNSGIIASSPEFEIGDSAIKRRRTKKKNKEFLSKGVRSSCGFSKYDNMKEEEPDNQVSYVSSSIDLYKVFHGSQQSNRSEFQPNSPTASSANCRELEDTIAIGYQLGF